jgi:hypothetical protein
MTDTPPIRVRVDGLPLVWTVIRVFPDRVELAAAGRRATVHPNRLHRVDEPAQAEAPT